MAAEELETHQIGDKQYVTLYDAARWLKIPLGALQGQIAFGKLEAVKIESREFIEYEALKAYVEKRNRQPSAWDRLDEWKG
jgi:hypothetical protein